MLFSFIHLPILLLLFSLSQSTIAISPTCKCTPSDPCWPSDDEFNTLNQTVAGKLIKGVPPGSVCYRKSPWSNYNEAECAYVRANWLNSTFHALNPISIGFPQWAGNPCPPIFANGTSVNGDPDAVKKGCSLGAYPVYALNATSAEHVSEIIKFVARHNIRLNVKSTGHSWEGRSTAYGSVSIWTHYLQGITHHSSFQPSSCPSAEPHMAFSIAAGSRVRDVYEAANENEYNAVAVGSSAEDVGIVGWLTGGGHGPLTSDYGMGSDNVIQATIVTPAGNIVTANECQHADLLWAIRGGGGGTYGVVTEVVMKGYPALPLETLSFSLTPREMDNVTAFWDGVTFWLSQLPRLKEGGMSGYNFLYGPEYFSFMGEEDQPWTLFGTLFVFGQQNGSAANLFQPIKQYMGNVAEHVNYTQSVERSPNFFAFWNKWIGYEPVGGGGFVLSSRLLTANSLTKDIKHMGEALRNLTQTTQVLHIYPVANNDTAFNDSLNPAWRDAVVHAITGLEFPDSATPEQQQEVYDENTDVLTPQLKSLAPDSGAYFNEADPFDPNWQYDFFGENYPRLQQIKKDYDPDSILWCVSCVGSEDWFQEESGRLCMQDWALDTELVSQM